MSRSVQELFRTSSLWDLFEDAPAEGPASVRDIAREELILPKNRRPIEEIVKASLPGDLEVREAWFEKLCPTEGLIDDMMAQAREGHRIAEEFPERGAYHGGPPQPDMGGVMQPYNPKLGRPRRGVDRVCKAGPRINGQGQPIGGDTSAESPARVPAFKVRGFPVFRAD